MTIEIRKVISGLALWDVIANGVMVGRFDTKWEASEYADKMRYNAQFWV